VVTASRAGKDAMEEPVMRIRRLTTAAFTVAAALAAAIAVGACGGSDETAAPAATPAAASPSAAATATPRPAATGPRTIAFTKRGEDSDDIYVVRPDGTGLRPLAATETDERRAAWSPDGSQIAYARGSGVWVMNADGSGQRKVPYTEAVLGLAWSPDGTQIVFSTGSHLPAWPNEREEDAHLVVVNADGSDPREVTPATVGQSDSRPVWAPDGRIFFARESRGLGEVCSVDPDGSGLTVVTAAPLYSSVSLSPDGKWLALWDRESDCLVRLSANGLGMEDVLVHEVSSFVTGPVASSWSPGGKQIAFAAGGWFEPSALYIIKHEPDIINQVTDGIPDLSTSEGWSEPSVVPNAGKGFAPAWQPR
jgi:Tol biopolymer transport system component